MPCKGSNGGRRLRPHARIWLQQRQGGRDWGLDPYSFLRLVKETIFPMMFYGALFWTSILCNNMELTDFDSVLVVATQPAFQLARDASMEVMLV